MMKTRIIMVSWLPLNLPGADRVVQKAMECCGAIPGDPGMREGMFPDLAVDGDGKLYMSCGTGCDAEFRRKVETWTDLPDGAFYEFHVITRDDVSARDIQEQTLQRHGLRLIGLRGLIDDCMAGRWKRGDPDYRQKLERRQDELNRRRRQERQRHKGWT
ncbi:MAG: hypothetical protein ABGZ35_22140 [Planctomycetaceae bacterium]